MMTLLPARRRAATFALAAIVALASVAAEARPGGSSGIGSRGSRTYSAPAPTATAPGAPRPIERSMTQPGPAMANQGMAQAQQPRRFGFGGGFFAGLLGAGLLGAVLGHGFMGGLGGLTSMLGLLLQIGLVVGLAWLAVRWFRNRQAGPALAGAGNGYARGMQGGPGGAGLSGLGGAAGTMSGGGSRPAAAPAQRDEVGIAPADYAAFEDSLQGIQAAYTVEDLAALRGRTTPEMATYFAEELRANAARGVVNRVTDVKLEQGDLSEAWREGATDWATVAMRFSLRDTTVERSSGRVVEQGPTQAVELWTFRRERGGAWILSAIQPGA